MAALPNRIIIWFMALDTKFHHHYTNCSWVPEIAKELGVIISYLRPGPSISWKLWKSRGTLEQWPSKANLHSNLPFGTVHKEERTHETITPIEGHGGWRYKCSYIVNVIPAHATLTMVRFDKVIFLSDGSSWFDSCCLWPYSVENSVKSNSPVNRFGNRVRYCSLWCITLRSNISISRLINYLLWQSA